MKKILYVDDAHSYLETGRRILAPYYKVITAISAVMMFKILEGYTPDLILLDVIMPGINGYEAIKRLNAEKPEIPVIFVTAKDDLDSELKGFELGAKDYIAKPFSASELLKRVEKEFMYIEKRKTGINDASLMSFLENTDEENRFFDMVGGLDELNIEIGLNNVMDRKAVYYKFIKVFHKNIKKNCDYMDSCIASGDITGFAAIIGGLKTSLDTVGAAELYKAACELEDAAKDADEDFCKNHFPDFYRKILKLHGRLSEILPQGHDK